MLDGLLKSKFYTKCKANVKMTKARVESIKKKKIAVQKFLKNDVADLLRNGLDMNAYNRAEGLLVEQNMARCYELVENFCANLSSNLSLMQKQRECPEECKEVVASLIYAAARFADLPELRDLRSTFTDRFGDSLQSYTNREFMERLSPMSYTKEVKLQLLQDIANEFSIEWDSKALEQMLFTPPTVQANNRVDIKYNKSNKEHLIPRRSNPVEYHRSGPQSSSEDGSTITEVSDDDDVADSKTAFRGGLRPPPPPYLKPKSGPGKTNTLEEQRNNLNPRSVRQRNQNNFNLKPPPGRAASMPQETSLPERSAPTRVASLPGDYDELAARIAALRGK